MARRTAARGGAHWRPVVGRRLRRGGLRDTLAGLRPMSISLPALGARWRRIALISASAMALALFVWWVYHSPLLSIRDVEVEGNTTLPAEVIEDTAGLKGASIIRPDFDAARGRLLALPLVKEVRIERHLLNGAQITVAQRMPFAVWQVNGQSLTVDAEGVVLDLAAPAGLPAVTQTDQLPEVPKPGQRVDQGAMAVAEALLPTAEQTLGRRVAALEFSQAAGLMVVLDGNLRVLFGDAQGYDFKLATLAAILQQAGQEQRPLTSVDLRFGERVAVR